MMESSLQKGGITGIADTVVQLAELESPVAQNYYPLIRAKHSGLSGDAFATIYSNQNVNGIASYTEGQDIYNRLKEHGKI